MVEQIFLDDLSGGGEQDERIVLNRLDYSDSSPSSASQQHAANHPPWTRESGKRCNDQHGIVELLSLNYIEVTRQFPSVNRTLTGGRGAGAKRADNDGLQAVDHGGQEQEPAYLAYVNCTHCLHASS